MNNRYEQDNSYVVEMGDKVKFDCHSLSITFANDGSFGTVFPMSDKNYRDSRKEHGHPMPNKVTFVNDGEYTTFYLTDDWGTVYDISIHNTHYSAIEFAIAEAKRKGLLEE